MDHKVTTEIHIEDKQLLQTLFQAVRMESQASEIKRGHIVVEIEENKLIVTTYGKDLVATRGLTNSIMRLLKTSIDVLKVIDESESD
ncbi:MAG: hypothetical protein IH840_08255 [Candidatus Heimdallarchaeota archaeon]|nr:hypothetical protein [Candidatus Heimdallarchaeota archaeon]